MQVEEQKDLAANPATERRENPRLAVDEDATLALVAQSAHVPCRIVELSLTGCRMKSVGRFPGAAGARLEATFTLRGTAFRLAGEVEWTDRAHLVGIRFGEMNARRRDELVETLCELAAAAAIKNVRQAAIELAAEEEARRLEPASPATPAPSATPAPPAPAPSPAPPGLAPDRPAPLKSRPLASVPLQRPAPPALASVRPAPSPTAPAPLASSPLASVPLSSRPLSSTPASAARGAPPQPLKPSGPLSAATPPRNGTAVPAPTPPPANAPAKPSGRERRTQPRLEVDTGAEILLVNTASRLRGRILDLSLGGCRIRTDERFPVGIYTRVETEFHLQGLPFRIGGVVQAVQDKHHVGIRFLDVSERKRHQIEQLTEELSELQARSAPEHDAPAEPAAEPPPA